MTAPITNQNSGLYSIKQNSGLYSIKQALPEL